MIQVNLSFWLARCLADRVQRKPLLLPRTMQTNRSVSDADEAIDDSTKPHHGHPMSVCFSSFASRHAGSYRTIANWLNPRGDLFRFNVESLDDDDGTTTRYPARVASLAVVLCVGKAGADRLLCPGRFAGTDGGRTAAGDRTSAAGSDGSMTVPQSSPAVPSLCCVRRVADGDNLLCITRLVSAINWRATLAFYDLYIGNTPDTTGASICIYSVRCYSNCKVLFTLQKLPDCMAVERARDVVLCIALEQAGALVPLLPNVCTKFEDGHWATTDPDGNLLHIEVRAEMAPHGKPLRRKTKTRRHQRHGKRGSCIAEGCRKSDERKPCVDEEAAAIEKPTAPSFVTTTQIANECRKGQRSGDGVRVQVGLAHSGVPRSDTRVEVPTRDMAVSLPARNRLTSGSEHNAARCTPSAKPEDANTKDGKSYGVYRRKLAKLYKLGFSI